MTVQERPFCCGENSGAAWRCNHQSAQRAHIPRSAPQKNHQWRRNPRTSVEKYRSTYVHIPSAPPFARSHPLPPLPRCPRVAHPARSARAQILDQLRAAAFESRRLNCRSFYSIRSVADHFRISTATVFRYYKILKAEGLLASSWGSGTTTIVAGQPIERRMRGVVALPICLESFASVVDERALVLSLQETLWDSGFAVRTNFHDAPEVQKASWLDGTSSLDAVVWIRPPRAAHVVLPAAAGVRLLVVDASSTDFPADHYRVSRAAALRSALCSWREHDVRSIAVALPRQGESHEISSAIRRCSSALDLGTHDLTPSGASAEVFLARLSQMRAGIVFPSSAFAAALASRAPGEFARLLSNHRVLLPEGAIDVPALGRLGITPDALSINAPAIAARVTDDLVTRRVPERGEPVASAALCRPLRDQAA